MFIDLFFPNRCLNCNKIIAKKLIICECCKKHISFTHWEYFQDNLLKQKCQLLFPVEYAYSLLFFDKKGLSREIIHNLKYKNREFIGEILAHWTLEHIDFKSNKPDLLITVPLHRKKQRERGFNQLHLFAETLSKNINVPYNHLAVKRNFYKKAQALKNKKQRNETQNLFSLSEDIEGKHILIIDDVFTTGNTINSIAWEFIDKGNKVSILVIAIDK